MPTSAPSGVLHQSRIPVRRSGPPKILHVHVSDGPVGGGAGVVMSRLNQRLRDQGLDAKILCRKKTTEASYVAEIPHLGRPEYWTRKLTKRVGLNDVHRLGSFKIGAHPFFRDADIVDYHGTHSRTLSYLALPSLTREKTSVFSLHDMWAVTGHCAASYECERWKIGCGKCPHLDTHPAVDRDATRIEWLLKKWALRHSSLVLVAVSRWLLNVVKQSMLSDLPVYLIPNGVDCSVYRLRDRQECRARLGIPADKRVIMFSAIRLYGRGKGSEILVKALRQLPASLKAETVMLTMGYGQERFDGFSDIPVIHLGYIEDDEQKAIAYAAADAFVFPTRAETFGVVSIESLACGTPVVSFDVGGVPEHVRPGETGYLANRNDATDLRRGIELLLGDAGLRERFGRHGREMVEREYDERIRLARYLELYGALADSRRAATVDGHLIKAAAMGSRLIRRPELSTGANR